MNEEEEELEKLLAEAKEQVPKKKRGRPVVYVHHTSMAFSSCYYCGVHTMGVDHYPPRTARQFFPQIRPIEVRCCNECNSRLSNSIQPTLEERKNKLMELRYFDRYLAALKEEDFWKIRLVSAIKFTN